MSGIAERAQLTCHGQASQQWRCIRPHAQQAPCHVPAAAWREPPDPPQLSSGCPAAIHICNVASIFLEANLQKLVSELEGFAREHLV